MGKRAEQNKLHFNPKNQTAQFEQNTVHDDNLLPEAEELAKLKEVDSNIVGWLMNRIEAEQNARLDFNKKGLKLANKELNGINWINGLSIAFAFIVIMFAMLFSYFLIEHGLNVEGTLFAGGTIIIAASVFIRRPRKKK